MKLRLDRELKDLVGALAQADHLAREGNWAEARDRLQNGRATARRLGLPYARIAWRLCVALDNLGEVEEAFRMALEAIDQDPLAPEYRLSFTIVARRLRERVESLVPQDPSIPRLHALLAANDEADESTHLAMARHLVMQGDLAGARRLLEAVTTVSPNCADAWSLLAEVNAKLGDEEARSRCEVEATAARAAREASIVTHSPAL